MVSGSEVKFELLRQLNIDSEESVGFNARCKCARGVDGSALEGDCTRSVGITAKNKKAE